MSRITYGPCVGPDCDRLAIIKRDRLCNTHHKQKMAGRGMYPIGSRGYMPGQPMPADLVDTDIADFELLLSTGSTIATALVRMGMSGRTMQRRYQLAGRTTPTGLCTAASWTADELRKRVA